MQRGLGGMVGFACKGCASFKRFWPLAIAGHARTAIVLVFWGAAARAPFHPSGL